MASDALKNFIRQELDKLNWQMQEANHELRTVANLKYEIQEHWIRAKLEMMRGYRAVLEEALKKAGQEE